MTAFVEDVLVVFLFLFPPCIPQYSLFSIRLFVHGLPFAVLPAHVVKLSSTARVVESVAAAVAMSASRTSLRRSRISVRRDVFASIGGGGGGAESEGVRL